MKKYSRIIFWLNFYFITVIVKCEEIPEMHRIEAKLLQSKFRGTMLGVLAGDCCGLPFEFDGNLQPQVIKTNLNRLEGPHFKDTLMYSDDTAMTKVLAETIINGFSQVDLAKNFTEEYIQDFNRGYGTGIQTVFEKLKASNYQNVLEPAKEQYSGTGSYGNGGGMRVSPAALFCHNDIEKLKAFVREATIITHTNKLAINGALLQAFAIHQAIYLEPVTNPLNIYSFADELLMRMKEIEDDDSEKPYQIILSKMIKLLNFDKEPSVQEIIDHLGDSSSENALYSIPIAIYCFLRSHKTPIDPEAHAFRNTMELAICLGGDTDTVASMACAIAGAYYGEGAISQNLLKHCEGSEMIKDLADKLFAKFTGQN